MKWLLTMERYSSMEQRGWTEHRVIEAPSAGDAITIGRVRFSNSIASATIIDIEPVETASWWAGHSVVVETNKSNNLLELINIIYRLTESPLPLSIAFTTWLARDLSNLRTKVQQEIAENR